MLLPPSSIRLCQGRHIACAWESGGRPYASMAPRSSMDFVRGKQLPDAPACLDGD